MTYCLKCRSLVPITPGFKWLAVSHVTKGGEPCKADGPIVDWEWLVKHNWETDAMWDLDTNDHYIWPQ